MSPSGFFTTREDSNQIRRPRALARAAISSISLRKIGPAGVRNMNPKAISPEMLPDGNPTPLVYVLGEAPGAEEDKQGAPFMGSSGKMLRSAIPRWGLRESLFDNVVRTRPPNNRTPRREEVECFHDVVQASIEKAEPALILGVGRLPLTWVTGLSNIKVVRGKLFPVQVGKHRCWFMPVLHPSFLLRIAEVREDKVPGKEWIRIWEQDVQRAYDFAESCEKPTLLSAKEAQAGLELCLTLDEVMAAFEHLGKQEEIGWDFETSCLRPYRADSIVLSCAFSDGVRSFAFGIDHGEAGWSDAERGKILAALEKLLLASRPRKIAHNLPFELEWAVKLCGSEVLAVKDGYGCSLQAAFVLDHGPPGEGSRGHSLDDQCILHYGLSIKSLSPITAYMDRLREAKLKDLLLYNALDAKMALLLWRDKLMSQIDRIGLEESYQRQIDRVPAIVTAQRIGVPVDQAETKALQQQFDKEAGEVEGKIKSHADVRKYEKLYGGRFNPASPQDVGKLLGSMLQLPGIKTGEKTYSTNAKLLEGLKHETSLIGELLKLRSLHKLKGTYVDRFMAGHPDSYVYPDGRIHCQFGISRTATARLQSEGPNNQNWPKRKRKEVRKQLAAPKGWVFIAVDQGQIEGRTIAMHSKDREWVRMIFEDYDVHTEWTKKILAIKPDYLDLPEHGGNFKAARGTTKNGLVFPSFYGSSPDSIIYKLDLPEVEGRELFEEFWETFRGVKRWQRETYSQYQKEGCVWSLSGRRRLGPLSFQMTINSGPQITASDICVDAMVRLWEISVEKEADWLAAALQIHDDLTFMVPKVELDAAIEVIVREQLSFTAPWVNVPLSVEVEVGDNLLEMQSVGQWRSDRV